MTANSSSPPINENCVNYLNSKTSPNDFFLPREFKANTKYYYAINLNSQKNQAGDLDAEENNGEAEYFDDAQLNNFEKKSPFAFSSKIITSDNSANQIIWKNRFQTDIRAESNFTVDDDTTRQREHTNVNSSIL